MCAVRLGDSYRDGTNGMNIDLEQAMKWYEKASRMEGPGAGMALARMGEVHDYLGGSQYHNMKKAITLYTKAANANCAAGAFHMGECYEMGRGVIKPSGRQAVEWYSRAFAMFGEESIQAVENLVHIFRHGTDDVKPDERRAEFWETMLERIPSINPADAIESMIKDIPNTTIN